MTSPAQVEIVAEQVEDARAAGARVVTGGRRGDGPGDWYEPTLLAEVDHSMKVMREETFGPVIAVMKVDDVEQAIELANDTQYGLGSSVFAGDPAEGERIGRRIDAGHCNVNDVLINYNVLGLPMGGWKRSGIGTRHGAHGHPALLPNQGAHGPAAAADQVGADLVPLQRSSPRTDPAPVPVPQRARRCATGSGSEAARAQPRADRRARRGVGCRGGRQAGAGRRL